MYTVHHIGDDKEATQKCNQIKIRFPLLFESRDKEKAGVVYKKEVAQMKAMNYSYVYGRKEFIVTIILCSNGS